ncbi:hypothetical protein GCM10007989_01630 [Devosia pacifica]|uniref:Sec-independent protein translocase protein TatA n=1 Tax=Devosia pacifica TaxID=1335967 RepID=A0A918VNP6_9HYPH|nr:twin-arginine translocase TatA/TatE family subunit [Devosia pacifica]GHA10999.1 hypothetical protein GCM10007989_01630 [Devosia pacifica]
MHAPSIWGILIVAVVVILLFGRGKISGMMGEVASGIKAFQKGMRDDDKPSERIETANQPQHTSETRETEKNRDA